MLDLINDVSMKKNQSQYFRLKYTAATLAGIATILLFLFILTSGKPTTKKEKKPNIIFILADDMGYSDIGCYGGEIHTPNIDQLADNGIKIRSFYNNARCCPTRATLLTGEYPHTVGMGYMVTLANAKYEAGSYQGFLDDKYPTIAEDLRQAGYSTYMSGKWHVGERPQHWPLTRGFEHYYGLISGASSYFEIIPQEIGKRHFVLDDKDYPIPEDGFYMTDALTDHAIGYLNDENKKTGIAVPPFFLYLAYTAPHFPLHAYESDIAKYEKLYLQGWDVTREKRFQKMMKLGVIDKRYQLTERPPNIPAWEKQKDKKTWARKMAVYAAMIDRMDQNIGKLIAALKANNQYNNTMIIFLSDNGGCAENMDSRHFNDSTKKIGERGSYTTYDEPWANVSNTPFKKYKHFMHEGGIITPCIIHWPNKIKPKRGFDDHIGHVMDLLPTALEIAGISQKKLPGESLSYLWNERKVSDKTICWEHEGNQAIRIGQWKMVKDLEDVSWELYDMQSDPTETKNIAKRYPDRVNAMKAEYETWAKKVGVKKITASKIGE